MIPRVQKLHSLLWWVLHVVINNWLRQTVGVEHRYPQENTVWGKVYLLLSSVFFLGCVGEKVEINWHLLPKPQPIFRLKEMGRMEQEIIQRIILNYCSSSCLTLFSVSDSSRVTKHHCHCWPLESVTNHKYRLWHKVIKKLSNPSGFTGWIRLQGCLVNISY